MSFPSGHTTISAIVFLTVRAFGVAWTYISTRQAVHACISERLNVWRPCYRYANARTRDPDMQTDLRDFLARLARTIAMTLVPVALITFVTMPASLHHHFGQPADVVEAAPQHMT